MGTKEELMDGLNIVPTEPSVSNLTYKKIIRNLGLTCFGARDVADGARLFLNMINGGDTIWLGIAGAGIAGGLGGYVSALIKAGFIDVICSTGAQVYHDLHFAYGLPVKQGHPRVDDNKLRQLGIIRIYDTYIDEKETLLVQDEIIRRFCKSVVFKGDLSSADFNCSLGEFVLDDAKFPERSFLATAAKYGVPVFCDSNSNHSLGMNLAAMYQWGIHIKISSDLDVLESAAIAHSSKSTGFVELGGGGPKNFIQQTGPTISQILGINFEGADRGLQITTAIEKDGGLSGCTFSEGKTWGKYKKDAGRDLIQIFSDYTIVFPLLVGYVLENCKKRKPKMIMGRKAEMLKRLKKARRQ